MTGIVTKNSDFNTVILKGALEESSFFDIFRDISLPKHSGMLRIKSSGKEFIFYFKEGILVYSENTLQRMDEKILGMIKNSGLISRDTIVKCEKQKSKIMKSLLEILIEEGHVSMLLYSKIISSAVRMNILLAFMEKKGTYSFELRKTVREVHGVKPVDIKGVQTMASMSESKTKIMKHIINSLYCTVTSNSGADYLSVNKPFFQNFLITEIDFIKYMSNAVDDYISGGWTIQSRFKTDKVINTVSLYSFRALVFAGIAAFLYLATMTTTFETRTEHRSVKDFYFFKVSLLSTLYSLETGQQADNQKLIESGFITKKELDLSGLSFDIGNDIKPVIKP